MSDLREKVFAYIDERRDEMLALWETLVNMDSWTLAKADVDVVAEFVRQVIDDFGGTARTVAFEKAGNSVVGVFGKPTNKAHICFVGHYDTVFPPGTPKERPFTITDGKAYGPGALDMKGGLVIQMFVARALYACGYNDRQIKLLLAGDEEAGHPYSTAAGMIEEEARGAVAAFNFETGDVSGAVVVGRKGTASYDMTVKGVAVHAGREPQKGRSAILEMAHKIVDIQALTDYEAGVTFNVGVIKGGTARNAVPDNAEVEIDVRVMRAEQLAWVDEKIRAVAAKTYIDGTQTTLVRGTGGIGPMEHTRGNGLFYTFIKEQAAKTGHTIGEAIVSGGGSDSAYTVAAGVPTVDQLGVMGQWNHSDREYAIVETLFERAKVALECILAIDEFEKRLRQ